MGLLVLALPVLISIESPLTGFIYLFALYQAWSMNRKIEVLGPFHLKPQEAAAESDPSDELE